MLFVCFFYVIELGLFSGNCCSERRRHRKDVLLLQCGHKGVALTQLFKPFSRQPSSRTNCLWCNWGLRPLRKAYIGLYVEMFKEQWISISGCKIVFGASQHANHSGDNRKKDSFRMGWIIPKHLQPGNVMECSIRIKCVTKRYRLDS